jgi:hypothetical protein
MDFLHELSSLKQDKIEASNPVERQIGNESIWFTQSHIAEIVELLALQAEDNETVCDDVSQKSASPLPADSLGKSSVNVNSGSATSATQRQSNSNTHETLVEFFKRKGLKVVDKRFSGGALWVIGEKEQIQTYVEEACKHFCVTGQFGAGKASGYHPAWWTKDRK